jgi:tetratricopeptide (TPR) repeat protein
MITKQKNYRTISARLPQILGILVLLLSFIFTIVLIVLLTNTYKEYSREKTHLEVTQQKYEYWQSVTKKHPQFPIAYYEAAVYAIQLGKEKEARVLLQQVLVLDPNFYQAEILANEIVE